MKTKKKHGRRHGSNDEDVQDAVPGPTPGLRRFLYLSAGFFGAAVMIVEILGAKILAPYVGTSHFVWTAQIGVTLGALACGYYVGGLLADSDSSLRTLYFALFVAALWLVLTVVFLRPVAYAFIRLPLAAASLLSSIILYFLPLALLAMAGPFLLRSLTPSLRDVGRNAGRLSALNTAGSFAGTATIGYFLIPLVPSSVIMVGIASLLALFSIVYFLVWGRKAGMSRTLSAWMLFLALSVVGVSVYTRLAIPPDRPLVDLVETEQSAFGLLQVASVRNTTHLYFINDYLVQNTYDGASGKSLSSFTYLLEGLAAAYAPRLDAALCIGMGIGIVPRELSRMGVSVDAVEINPKIEPMARRYFALDSAEFNLVIADGRRFLETTDSSYDAVILDAFIGDSSPSHLMTAEAFTAVKRVLRSGGVVVVNSFADLADPEDFYANSLYRTMKSVFASVRVHGSPSGNALYVASDRKVLEYLHKPDLSGVHPAVRSDVEAAYSHSWTPVSDSGTILTDDFNPLEFRDAAKREAMRRMLALSLRGV